MSSKDPWSRSILTPSPSIDSCSDNDDYHPNEAGSTFVAVRRDNDLAAQLDLSRRDDRAVLKQNPFTMANANASRSKAKAGALPGRSSSKMGSSIRTAEDAGKKAPADNEARKPPPAKDAWRPNNGWTNGNGEPLASSAPTKKKCSVQSTPGLKRSKKTSQPVENRSTKRKRKKSESEIVFQGLPSNMSPTKDFPIVEGLERQKQLPIKPSSGKSVTIANKRGKTRQAPLDLDALIKGRTRRTEPQPPSTPRITTSKDSSPASSGITDIAVALASVAARAGETTAPRQAGRRTDGPERFNDIQPLPQLKATSTSHDGTAGAMGMTVDRSVTEMECQGIGQSAATESRLGSNHLEVPPSASAPAPDEHPRSDLLLERRANGQQLMLSRPVPVRPSVVSKLEALAADQLVGSGAKDMRRASASTDDRPDINSKIHRRIERPTEPQIVGKNPAQAEDDFWDSSYTGLHGQEEDEYPMYGQAVDATALPPYSDISQAPSHHTIHTFELPSPNKWASHIESQHPTSDADWSTLPKRSRLTLAPSSRHSGPKSSGPFRLPLAPFRTPVSKSKPSVPYQTPPVTPAVKVSVWSPARPKLTPTASAQPPRGYIPPHLRVLREATAAVTTPRTVVHSTPTRPATYLRAYPTPATVTSPGAVGGRMPPSGTLKRSAISTASNDSEDWAAAWALPNGR